MSQTIHIRVEGDQARDLRALHRWLSREDWFAQAKTEYGLQVAYREEDGTEREVAPDGPPMGGLITELVLVLTSAVLAPVFDDLYTRAKAAVCAWADNSEVGAPHVEAGMSQPGEGEGTALPDQGTGPAGTAAEAGRDGGDDGEAQ